MPDIRDFLPPPPWEGPPLPRAFIKGSSNPHPPRLKVRTFSRDILGREVKTGVFYNYLTEREVEFREQPPRTLEDLLALGSYYGYIDISQEELDRLAEVTPIKPVSPPSSLFGPHHYVEVGDWQFGLSWDRKLMEKKRKTT